MLDRQIQISTTCNVARMLGTEAAKRKVKAYVRLQLPFYETSTKGPFDEKQDPKPSGTAGTWWHETLRILANIEEYVTLLLPCAILSLISGQLEPGDTASRAGLWPLH